MRNTNISNCEIDKIRNEKIIGPLWYTLHSMSSNPLEWKYKQI
jgi:hypothetical protein